MAPVFPLHASLRVVGPNTAIVLVVAQGTTDAPLQIFNKSEAAVAEVAIDGQVSTLAGAFLARGPSIVDSVVSTS